MSPVAVSITLKLPSLARRTDKERLIRECFATEIGDGQSAAIEREAFQKLLDYSWPGNVRQLRNVIRTALAICDGGVIQVSDLPTEVRQPGVPQCNSWIAACDQPSALERETLMECIRDCKGNMSRVAQRLGVSRNTLYRRCKRLEIPLRRSYI